jgi:hypothetical protein
MTGLAVGLGVPVVIVTGVVGGAAARPARPRPRAVCSVPTALPRPPANRPHYVLRVRVARSRTTADGTLAVSFAPPVATDRLVFRLWPNSP